MSLHVSSRAARVIAAGAVLVAMGCGGDRSSVLEPSGPISIGSLLLTDGRNIPTGQVIATIPLTAAEQAAIDTTVEIRVHGLDSLTTGVYQVWLAETDNATVTAPVKATGTLMVIRTDTTLSPEGDPTPEPDTTVVNGVSSFTNGGPATEMVLTVSLTSAGVDPMTKNLVLISIEPSNASTEPSGPEPLWARTDEGDIGGTATIDVITTPFAFGNFDPDPDAEYVFSATGRGRVGYRENILVIDDSSLARPPVGYYYAAWLVKQDSATNAAEDSIPLGPQMAPFPDRGVSLYTADVATPHPVVQVSPPSITAAANRVDADTVAALGDGRAAFRGIAQVFITLEAKAGDPGPMSPSLVLSGPVPDAVRFARP